jgi:peptidyl-prolyl cis-trans isomerase SurA
MVGVAAQAQSLRPSTQLRPAPGAATAMTGGQRSADYIVAIVNSEPVTNSEVRSRMVRIEQQLTQQGAALPPREELARQVLERLIGEHAQLQVARDNGVRVDEAAIEQAVRNVAQQNQLEVTELRRRVEADGTTWAQFRNDMRDQILLTRVREREVDPTVKVTEQDIDQFIREQQDSTDLSSMEINLGQILIAVPENAAADQISALQTRAQQVLTRARAGEDFAKLAREFSESRDRVTGGVLGLRVADRYPPLFVEATASLPVGAFAPLLRSGAGFHILKVIEKKQAGLPGVAVTQTRARHILLRTGNQVPESVAVARLADFKRRMEAGQADFATLARENSQDGSAKDGGELGWANPGQFVPEFEEVMNGLTLGQVSEPLVSRFGAHLIQVEERREATLSQREQRDIARNLVREKKLDEAYNNWVRDVRGRAYVELREPPQLQ